MGSEARNYDETTAQDIVARSEWEEFWRRFRRDWLALAGGAFIVLLVVLATVGAPLSADLTGHEPDEQFFNGLDVNGIALGALSHEVSDYGVTPNPDGECFVLVNIESAVDSVNSGIIQTRASRVPCGINSWSQDYPDPDNFIDSLLDGRRITETNNQNQGNFDSAEIDEEIASPSGVTGEARDTAYHALDAKIMAKHAPWAPLLNPIRVDVVSDRVTSYPVHPIYGPDLAATEVAE